MSKRRKGRWKYNCCHAGRVQQELRANSEYREDGERVKWGRGSRGKHQLDQWLNDKPHNHEKSWKRKRKTQYRDRASMQEHTLEFDNNVYKWWDVQEWFDDHDIPCRIERINETWTQTQTHRWKRIETGPYPYIDAKGIKRYRYHYEHVRVRLTKPITYQCSRTIGWRLTWWSDKDIGIEYVLKRCFWNYRF
jgi:hypothetical protein